MASEADVSEIRMFVNLSVRNSEYTYATSAENENRLDRKFTLCSNVLDASFGIYATIEEP